MSLQGVKEPRPRGRNLLLECGHRIEWPRPVTDLGHVYCPNCGFVKRKIVSVR